MHNAYQFSGNQVFPVVSHLLAMTLLQNTLVARCYTLPPFFFFEGKLIGFSGFLAITCWSDSMLKRERRKA